MTDPGGERQDPRLDAAAKFVEECWGHEGQAARDHAADFLAAVDAAIAAGAGSGLTREEADLVLWLMTDSDLEWAAYAPPHGRIGRLHDEVVAKLRAVVAMRGGNDG